MANEYVAGAAGTPDLSNWIRQVWLPEIGIAAYEEMRLKPLFKQLPMVEGTIIFRKQANLARNVGSETAALYPLTYSGQDEARVTKVPQTSYVAVGVNQNVIWRMTQDPTDTFRRSIEMSLAEGVDVECAKLADDLVNVVGGVGQNVTEATFLDGLVMMAENAKMEWDPRAEKGAFVFHTRQIDDVLASTQNWSQYQITGRTDGPVTSGFLKSAYGCRFVSTGNIQSIGGVFHNPLFIREVTFGIGFNQEPTVEAQKRDLVQYIIGATDFAAVTMWDVYGADYNTGTAA